MLVNQKVLMFRNGLIEFTAVVIIIANDIYSFQSKRWGFDEINLFSVSLPEIKLIPIKLSKV